MKHHISLSTVYGPSRDDKKYMLEVWTQSWLDRLGGEIYDWYHRHLYKVPGFRRLEKWLQSRHKGDVFYIPLGCRMDIRCYHLRERSRTMVSIVQLTEVQYCEIKKSLYHGTCDAA